MIDLTFLGADDGLITSSWLDSAVACISTNEEVSFGEIAVVVGSDEWLLDYNKTYLNHDYYTDIITFDYSSDGLLSGDLLISSERVRENADEMNVSRETEMRRVVIHGLLHLCGYKDKSSQDIELMRKKEDFYLSLL